MNEDRRARQGRAAARRANDDAEPPIVSTAEIAHLPGKRGLPVVGAYPEALLNPLGFARRMHDRFGPIHRFWANGQWNVQILGPEGNELVLFDRDQAFSSKWGWGPIFGPYFSGGLILRDFEDHRVHRRYIATAFRAHLLQGYLRSFQKLVAEALLRWSGREIDFYREIRRLLLENATITFFGLPAGEHGDRLSAAFDDLEAGLTSILPEWMPGSGRPRGARGRDYLFALMAAELPKRRGGDRPDLFSQLCNIRDDDGRHLPEEDVFRHMMFVLAAAHDTMTASLSAMAWQLAADARMQGWVRDELADLGPPDRLTVDALADARLTDRVLKEAMRLAAPAPIIWRRAVKPYRFAGYDVPAGTMTAANPAASHRLPHIWPDPERFDPDRFSDANSAARHKFAYVPFGGGAHICLGLTYSFVHSKGFWATVLRGHRLLPRDRFRPRWYPWPTTHPLNGLPIRFERLG